MNILPTKEDQRMKKIVALILTCVLLLGLVSAHAEEPGRFCCRKNRVANRLVKILPAG